MNFRMAGITLACLIGLVGCGGGGTEKTTATEMGLEQNSSTGPVQTGEEVEDGKISVYYKKRTPTSILAETRVESPSGIKKITLYCIDAYKFYEKNELRVIGQYSKEYDPATTKIEFFQHLFDDLYYQKSYIIKAVAETEAGVLHQMMTTATLPLPRIKQSLDLSPYDVYHHTQPEYTFNLSTPTQVKDIEFEEYDGDDGLFDFYLKASDGSEITVATDVVSSGDDVAKTHYFTNPEQSKTITAVIIRTHSSLGGLWQLNALVINP